MSYAIDNTVLQGFQKTIFTAIVLNETGGRDEASFQMRPPIPNGESGWTFGPIQYDLKKNSVESAAVMGQVLGEAKSAIGVDDATITSIIGRIGAGKVTDSDMSVMNRAMTTTSGREALLRASEATVTGRIDYIQNRLFTLENQTIGFNQSPYPGSPGSANVLGWAHALR